VKCSEKLHRIDRLKGRNLFDSSSRERENVNPPFPEFQISFAFTRDLFFRLRSGVPAFYSVFINFVIGCTIIRLTERIRIILKIFFQKYCSNLFTEYIKIYFRGKTYNAGAWSLSNFDCMSLFEEESIS